MAVFLAEFMGAVFRRMGMIVVLGMAVPVVHIT